LSSTAGHRAAEAAKRPQDDVWRLGLRWTPLLPAVLGAIAAAAPEWSTPWAVVAAVLLAVDLALMVMVVYRGRYVSMRWRGAYVVYTFDLLSFFCLVIAWRGLHAPAWVDMLLGCAFVVVAVLGHVYRRAIAQELFAPRTPLGLAFAALGTIGAGGAGLLAYGTGSTLPSVILLTELYLAALVILLVSHSTWTRVDDPTWRPARARR
jgi:hypothetical protein